MTRAALFSRNHWANLDPFGGAKASEVGVKACIIGTGIGSIHGEGRLVLATLTC